MPQLPRPSLSAYLKKLLQFFLQGLIVLAPIGITIWVVLGLFNYVDGFLPNLVNNLAPQLLEKDAAGKPRLVGFKFLRLQEQPLKKLEAIDGPGAPKVTLPGGGQLLDTQ